MNYTMKKAIILLLFGIPIISVAEGNQTIQSYRQAKKLLEKSVYFDHRETLYCSAKFTDKKIIIPPAGFISNSHKKRSKKVEWEHVVPAENFGRTFSEWREGHEHCIDKKGKPFKGRPCASKMNTEYRYMQSDLYNLFPAIGSVNAKRSNYNFATSLDSTNAFGSCSVKILGNKVEPPEQARGRIARAYLYMDDAYKRYKMSRSQRQLMTTWDRLYPVSDWECQRALRIKAIQGNENHIMAARCK